MISTNQFKNGKVIKIDNDLYAIISFQHIKPGKGGAFVRTKLRNVKFGNVIDRTFRSGERFEEAYIDQKKFQYLYRSGKAYHFMDMTHYDQLELSEEVLGECVHYLKENDEVIADLHEGRIIGIEPPLFVELKVTHTEPGIRGDTARGGTKPATLETGLTIQVPLFINTGDVVRVDTRTAGYVVRVS